MNKYTFRVQFGDGKPKEITVESTAVVSAITKGEREYPGATNFHLLSVDTPKLVKNTDYSELTENNHPLFTDYINFTVPCEPALQEKIRQAVSLRWKGLNYKEIAKELKVSRNSVSFWFKHYV